MSSRNLRLHCVSRVFCCTLESGVKVAERLVSLALLFKRGTCFAIGVLSFTHQHALAECLLSGRHCDGCWDTQTCKQGDLG